MSNDLKIRITEMVEAVPTVSANEARQRAATSTLPRRPAVRRRRFAVGSLAVAAVAAAVLTVVQPWNPNQPVTPQAVSPVVVRLVADTSAAALSSGTAHMTITDTSNGKLVNAWKVEMAFSGADITENVTYTTAPPTAPPGMPPSTPLPPSRFSMAVVDGIVYRQIAGTWYAEAESQAPNILAAPTPRTLLSRITPAARIIDLGTDRHNGWTHLRAANPAALLSVLNGQVIGAVGGKMKSVDLWVDNNRVVRQMTWTTSGKSAVCPAEKSPVSTPMRCTYTNNLNSVTITFANIGATQHISAPSPSQPGHGPYDGPSS